MLDMIAGFLNDIRSLLVIAFGVATAAGMAAAYMKTRSAPAVLGTAVLGLAAILIVANMNFFVNQMQGDIIGTGVDGVQNVPSDPVLKEFGVVAGG